MYVMCTTKIEGLPLNLL